MHIHWDHTLSLARGTASLGKVPTRVLRIGETVDLDRMTQGMWNSGFEAGNRVIVALKYY